MESRSPLFIFKDTEFLAAGLNDVIPYKEKFVVLGALNASKDEL